MTGKMLRNFFYMIIYAITWKLRYGGRIRLGFPLGLEKTRVEMDRQAQLSIGSRTQNRGPLFLGCKQDGNLSIGSHCFFNINCSVTCMKKITIGEYCKFGNNLVIVDHDHNYRKEAGKEFTAAEIVIGDRVWVGANCVILKGVAIGADAVIAAGSIVRKNVPAGSVYVMDGKPV